MLFFPGHEAKIADETLTRQESTWIALYQFLIVLLSIQVIYWLAYNIWKILIKRQKWKVLPLMTFYVLASLIIIMDIFKIVNFVNYFYSENIILHLYPPTLKFLLGVEQAWINIELIYCVKFSIEMARQAQTTFSERSLRIGRKIIIVFVVLVAITALAIFTVVDITLDDTAKQ